MSLNLITFGGYDLWFVFCVICNHIIVVVEEEVLVISYLKVIVLHYWCMSLLWIKFDTHCDRLEEIQISAKIDVSV